MLRFAQHDKTLPILFVKIHHSEPPPKLPTGAARLRSYGKIDNAWDRRGALCRKEKSKRGIDAEGYIMHDRHQREAFCDG